MEHSKYVEPKSEKYLVYNYDPEDDMDLSIDITRILNDKQVQKGSPLEGAPVYLTGKELKQYLTSSPSPKP